MREVFWLVLILGVSFAIFDTFWASHWQPADQSAYRIVAGICLICGTLAIGGQAISFSVGADFAGTMASILLRTIVPVLAVLVIAETTAKLVAPRYFPAFVSCYLLTLFVETILSVRLINRWEQKH